MKAIIIDKNEQSREIVLNILKNIENTKEAHSFEDFPKDFDYGEIDLIVFDIDSKNSKEILDKAILYKGTTIRSYTSSLGVSGNYQDFLLVHTKKICPICNTPISKDKIGGRSSYYCSKCQVII